MPKWESMIFIAIVFTILKDEIVMQNHYVCCNYFDKYFVKKAMFFSFPNRLSLFQENCENTSTQKFFTSALLVVTEIWKCCSKILTNEIESTCGSFGPQNVSPQPNENEYMCESFRPGTVNPSCNLTNETECMCESFRPGTDSPSYSLTNKTESYL